MNVLDMNRKNRSIRKFTQEPLPEESLQYILENLRYCHCGNNRQRLRYILVTSAESCAKTASLVHYASLLPPEIGEPGDAEKPTAYIVITKPSGSGPVVDFDAGIAAQVITESAFEKGIGSCIILNFQHEELNQALEIEEERTASLVVALGFPAIASDVVDVENGDLRYFVDEKGYHVPKLDVKDLVKRK